MRFKHYIITRFNVKVDAWKQTRNHENVLTEEWLDHRFLLFQKYCLPSIQNQSIQEFKWLVFFDSDTGEEYRDLINGIADRYANFTPLYIEGYHVLLDTLKNYISKENLDTEYIITSRVDNDDCIHRDYVKEIQDSFNQQQSCVVDIIDGYQIILDEYQPRPIIEFRKARGYLNPFISLIEKASELNTVMAREHLKWKDAAQVRTIRNKRLWGEIIHHKNKLNTVRPLARIVKDIDYSAFALKKEDIKPLKTLKYIKSYAHVNYLKSYYLLKRNTPSGLKQAIKAIIKK